MTHTIWKFQLQTTDKQIVRMPAGAEILCVQTQNGEPCLWALVTPDNPMTDRFFLIFGTGHPLTAAGKYIGTYQLHGGALVFHVFEE